MSEITTKKPSFWDKPEGLIGMIGAFAAAGGLLYFLSWFVPFMLKLGLGILGMGIIWGTIVGLIYLIGFDNPLRRAVSMWYQLKCRKLHKLIVDEDPIGVMRLLQGKARKRLEEFDKLLPSIQQSKRAVDQAADQYKGQLDTLHAKHSLYVNDNNVEEIQRTLARIGKIDKYLSDMTVLSAQVGGMSTQLNRARKVVHQIIDDTDFEINNEQLKFGAIKNVNGTWKKLRSVFKTSSDESELRNEALMSIAEQNANRLGEVDQFMIEFQDVLNAVSVNEAIDAEKARLKMEGLNAYQFGNTPSLSNNPSPAVNMAKNAVHYQPSVQKKGI